MCDPRREPGAAARPAWGWLYAVLPLGFSLVVAAAAVPPGGWRTVAELAAALAVFGTMAAWVRANRGALDQVDWCRCAAETLRVSVVPSRRPMSDGNEGVETRLPWAERIDHVEEEAEWVGSFDRR